MLSRSESPGVVKEVIVFLLQRAERCVRAQSCPTLCDPWTVDHQAPLSMGFSRQEYWSGLPCPSPGNFPNPKVQPVSPALQADFFFFLTTDNIRSTSKRRKSQEPFPKGENVTIFSFKPCQCDLETPQDPQRYSILLYLVRKWIFIFFVNFQICCHQNVAPWRTGTASLLSS